MLGFEFQILCRFEKSNKILLTFDSAKRQLSVHSVNKWQFKKNDF